MQSKELTHLIQCGALDGLGENRAALLSAAQEKQNSANAWQLTLAFDAPTVTPETDAQRLQWERQVLGQPVSVHPVAVMDKADKKGCGTLTQAAANPGRRLPLAVTRLPGWTGGKGFFISDGVTYMVAIPAGKLPTPRPWTPLVLTGRWMMDEWGDPWIQVEGWEVVGLTEQQGR